MKQLWRPTTEERFDDMLGVLPPADMYRKGFLVGEAMDHFGGLPRYSAFTQAGSDFFECVEPLTVRQFRAELDTFNLN